MDGEGSTSSIVYDEYGNPIKFTDGEGNAVCIEYDAYGNPVQFKDANGNVTYYEYSNMNRCVRMIDALGHRTEYSYDAAGRVNKVTRKAEKREGETQSDTANRDIINTLSYDAMGNVIAMTDGENNTFHMEYDKMGHVTKIYDAYDRLYQAYTYDAVYQVTSITNGTGCTISNEYDTMGNLIARINQADGSVSAYTYTGGKQLHSTTDSLGGEIGAKYDAMGRVKSFTNPNGGLTEYAYDHNGKLIDEKVGSDYHIHYTYDKNGRISSRINSRGQKTEYQYNKSGYMTQQKDEAGTIRYTYDGNGNMLSVTEDVGLDVQSGQKQKESTDESDDGEPPSSVIQREYDALNRVKSYTDGRDNSIGYTYDEFDNLVSLTYPDGRAVRYTYDKNGSLLTQTDWDGRVTRYAYDKNGRLVKTNRPDGSTEERSYDAAGNLLSIVDKTADGQIINSFYYTYDLKGNITRVTNKNADGNAPAPGRMVNETVLMEYDNVNRLTSYNGKTVKYDLDGNMTYGPLNGEMAYFTYDCRNRLTETKTDNGAITRYEYDAENNRTALIQNVGTPKEIRTEYVIDSGEYINAGKGSSDDVAENEKPLTRVLVATEIVTGEKAEPESDKQKTSNTKDTLYQTTYLYGNGLISQEKSQPDSDAEILYYHFNNVGSTTALTDENGAIKYSFTYAVYGDLLSGEYGEIAFLYNGQYGVMSDDNGLYYMRTRYYNVEIKRFINQDTIAGNLTSTQSLNRYAYVEGNPVSFLDPWGLEPTIYDHIHKVTNYYLKFSSIVNMGLMTLAIANPEVALEIEAMLIKSMQIQTAVSVANTVISVVEIFALWDTSNESERTDRIAKVAVDMIVLSGEQAIFDLSPDLKGMAISYIVDQTYSGIDDLVKKR